MTYTAKQKAIEEKDLREVQKEVSKPTSNLFCPDK